MNKYMHVLYMFQVQISYSKLLYIFYIAGESEAENLWCISSIHVQAYVKCFIQDIIIQSDVCPEYTPTHTYVVSFNTDNSSITCQD